MRADDYIQVIRGGMVKFILAREPHKGSRAASNLRCFFFQLLRPLPLFAGWCAFLVPYFAAIRFFALYPRERVDQGRVSDFLFSSKSHTQHRACWQAYRMNQLLAISVIISSRPCEWGIPLGSIIIELPGMSSEQTVSTGVLDFLNWRKDKGLDCDQEASFLERPVATRKAISVGAMPWQ